MILIGFALMALAFGAAILAGTVLHVRRARLTAKEYEAVRLRHAGNVDLRSDLHSAG